MKGRKAPFKKYAQTRSSIPGGRGHSDLKTLKHRTRGGYKYIAILVDDCTRKRWVAFLRKKSDFLEELRKWMDELNSEGVQTGNDATLGTTKGLEQQAGAACYAAGCGVAWR
jgi:hypothetical protein